MSFYGEMSMNNQKYFNLDKVFYNWFNKLSIEIKPEMKDEK